MAAQQTELHDFEPPTSTASDGDLEELTDAERDAYEAVEEDGKGVTEYARETERSKGTVGNLLARAKDKLETDS